MCNRFRVTAKQMELAQRYGFEIGKLERGRSEFEFLILERMEPAIRAHNGSSNEGLGPPFHPAIPQETARQGASRHQGEPNQAKE